MQYTPARLYLLTRFGAYYTMFIMKINDKKVPLFLILIAFGLLYLFLAAESTGKKLNIRPEWTVSIDNPTINTTQTSAHLLPFKMGEKMGYYTADGKVGALIPFEHRAAISADFWTEYDRDAERIAFFTPDNQSSGIFDRSGFPFFDAGGIFLFHPGGSSFSKHDKEGKTEWLYENYVPITAFSSSTAGCAAGFADGNLVCFDRSGKVTGGFYPGGSNMEVIFGAALSQSGTYCACLSGLDPQRIVVAEPAGGKTKIIYHEYLKDELREQTLVQFSSDDRYVFFSGKGALISVFLPQKKAFFVPFPGKIVSISEFGGEDIFFVLSKDTETYTVTILSEGKYKRGSFSFKASNAFVHSENGDIYVGCDGGISKMHISFD